MKQVSFSSSDLLCDHYVCNNGASYNHMREKGKHEVHICRGLEGGTHSRVAERTRLFPEGEYSGKC